MPKKREQPEAEEVHSTPSEDEDAVSEEDFEEEEGDDNVADVKHVTNESKYRPPTAGELQKFEEAQALFQTNLFKMQMEELLSEVKCNYEHNTVVDAVLTFVRERVSTLSNRELSWKDIASSHKDLCGAVSDLPMDDVSLTFAPPADVVVGGDWQMHTCIRQKMTIDIHIVMPKSCFYEKDYKQYKYICKRILYLHALVEAFTPATKKHRGSSDTSVSIISSSFEDLNGGDVRYSEKPVVRLTCSVGVKKISIRLIPACSEETFKLNDVQSTKSNTKTGPSPYYNMLIAEDVARCSTFDWIASLTNNNNSLREAVIMLKIYLDKRELSKFYEPLVVLLCQVATSMPQASSYQLFRALMDTIVRTDWSIKGFGVCSDSLLSCFSMVITPASGAYNAAFRITAPLLLEIKHEAKRALNVLRESTQGVDPFDILFLTKLPFTVRYDVLVTCKNQIRMKKHTRQLLNNLRARRSDKQYVTDSEPQLWSTHFICSEICSLLKIAMDNRIEFASYIIDQDDVTFGVHCSTGSDSAVEEGPAADDLESVELFRRLFGDKVETRRFRDGSIRECAVFDPKSSGICGGIISHLLKTHFQVGQIASSSWAPMLLNDEKRPDTSSAFAKVYSAVSNKIRALYDLPLSIKDLHPISSSFRNTQLFMPVPHPLAMASLANIESLPASEAQDWPDGIAPPVHQVVIELESSSRWPNDLDAIRATKAAFYLKMSKLMAPDSEPTRKKSRLEKMLLAKESNMVAVPAREWCDVMCEGYVFRFAIRCEKELNVLKSMKDETKGPIPAHMIAEQTDRLEVINNWAVHHSLLINVVRHRHSCYSETVRLVKAWTSAHLLDGFISEQVIELLIAFIFTQELGVGETRDANAGLIRFFTLMTTFDFEHNAIVVDPDNLLSADSYTAIHEDLKKSVAARPTMYISTPHDPRSSTWSLSSPNAQGLSLLRQYANSALAMACGDVMHGKTHPLSLYNPSFSAFDVVIKIDPFWKHGKFQNISVNPKYKNLTPRIVPGDLMPGFDPVFDYIVALIERFGDIAMFFYSPNNTTIGVSLRPSALVPAPLASATAYRTQPSTGAHVNLAVNDMLVVIKDMGQGLVHDVCVAQCVL